MARPSGPKNRCGERWTESRFKSFITSLIRSGTRRWAPISDVLKKARVRRGVYLCAGYGIEPHEVPASIPNPKGGKRIKNAVVDHIDPVVDPKKGFESWDTFIERLYCEEDNLQVLCHDCHTRKSNDERERRSKN